MVWNLSPAEFIATQEKIAKINARASKKGFTGSITVKGELIEKTEKNQFGVPITNVFYATTIDGEPAHYDGWTFLATAEWDINAGLIVRTAPGVFSIDRDSLIENGCAHCGITRYRKATYILGNVKGEQIQVGSACIKDFLPSGISPHFIDEDSITEEISGGFYANVDPSYSVDTVLGIAWAAIKTLGWVPASSYEGMPTRYVVSTVLSPPSRMTTEERMRIESIGALADEMADKAKIVREFIISDDFSGDSEYVLNLKSLMSAEYVSAKNIGFLASAPQAWSKFMSKTLIEAKAPAKESNWIASVGDKITVKATLTMIRYIESDYGTSVLYKFIDNEGNVITWFSSRDKDLVEGNEYSIFGTVKKNDQFSGVKQNVLTRCKIS